MNKDLLKQTRIDNLKLAQASRKEDSLARVNQAIKQMEKRKEKINFQTVAKAANVSVAYLYKYPEIKQRIAEIRNTQSKMMIRSEFKSTSEASQAKIQAVVKERIQKLELENKELRRKNEALAGQVYRIHQLQSQIERQQQIIEDLEKKLNQCQPYQSKPSSKVTSIKKNKQSNNPGNDDNIKSELKALNIKMNTTLSRLIEQVTEQTVLKAIDTLKEALSTTKVRNPAGFLVEAIKNTWIPNEGYEEKVELDIFNEWFPIARSKRLVLASTKIEGVLHVCTHEGELIPFEEMIAKYPLERLQEME